MSGMSFWEFFPIVWVTCVVLTQLFTFLYLTFNLILLKRTLRDLENSLGYTKNELTLLKSEFDDFVEEFNRVFREDLGEVTESNSLHLRVLDNEE